MSGSMPRGCPGKTWVRYLISSILKDKRFPLWRVALMGQWRMMVVTCPLARYSRQLPAGELSTNDSYQVVALLG